MIGFYFVGFIGFRGVFELGGIRKGFELGRDMVLFGFKGIFWL